MSPVYFVTMYPVRTPVVPNRRMDLASAYDSKDLMLMRLAFIRIRSPIGVARELVARRSCASR